MRRINIYIPEDQLEYLEKTQISVAEHYRRAMDKYIQELKGLNVSASQSKRGDEENG